MTNGTNSKAGTDTPRRRTRRSAEDLRAKIIAAASAAFRAQGYDGATTAAIARDAEVTEAQLFRYFATKAQLFREAVFDPIDRHLLDFTERQASGAAAFGDSTLTYIEQLQAFIAANSQAFLSVLSAQQSGRIPPGGAAPIESLQGYFDHGAAMLAHRPGEAPMDPHLAVRMAFASVLGTVIFHDWLFPAGRWSEAEIAVAINRFVLNSVAASPDAAGG